LRRLCGSLDFSVWDYRHSRAHQGVSYEGFLSFFTY